MFAPFDSIFFKKFASFFESQSRNRGHKFKGLKGKLLVDNSQLFGESGFKTLKDVNEKTGSEVHDFMVGLLDSHFEVQTGELAEMSVGVGVFGSKHMAHFEYFLEISLDAHLLVKLGTLSQTSLLTEIFQVEHVRSSFRGTSNKFGSVDLHKFILVAVFSEKLADSTLKSENSLFSRGSQIQNSVVKSGFHTDINLLIIFVVFGVFFSLIKSHLIDFLGSIIDLKRHDLSCSVDHKKTLDL